MSYRKFLDANGVSWQVWDVVPAEAERRLRERRLLHDPPDEDQRSLVDRRGSAPRKPALPTELLDGWLVFQSEGARKRYWPIPHGWERLASDELRALCVLAHTVGRVRDGSALDQTLDVRRGQGRG